MPKPPWSVVAAATAFAQGDSKEARGTAHNGQCWNTARELHDRVEIARRVPKILSAHEPKQVASGFSTWLKQSPGNAAATPQRGCGRPQRAVGTGTAFAHANTCAERPEPVPHTGTAPLVFQLDYVVRYKAPSPGKELPAASIKADPGAGFD